MDSSGISMTSVLAGLLPFVVLIAAALSLPSSYLLVRRYRSAILKGMAAGAGVGVLKPAPQGQRGPCDVPLVIQPLEEASWPAGSAADLAVARLAARAPWRFAMVYAYAGFAYATVMTVGWLLATRDVTLVWSKLALLFWTYFWPTAVAVLLVAAYDSIRRWQLLGAYFAVLAGLVAVSVVRNPDLGLLQLPYYWVLTNGPGSILLMTFLLRPIRAVGPLVLAFLLVVALGSQSIVSVAAADEDVLRAIGRAGIELGLGARTILFGMILFGIVAFAALGWPLLRWFGRRYEAKKLSEQSITVDSLFLTFGVMYSIGLVFEGAIWILTGVVAFAAYKAATVLGFSMTRDASGAPRTLLLLRVFRLGKRSERLFDRLRRHWQRIGSISMIAGPDLVTTNIEPHELLGFVTGRLGRQFVSTEEDLDRRIAAIDGAADPDGTHRVNEFFCRADTWQITMQRLAARSDAVLMDLRSFSPANQGCVFELGRLLDDVDLGRVVFLIDRTTDRAFLVARLQELWGNVSALSPNRHSMEPAARMYSIAEPSERAVMALVGHLLMVSPQSGAGRTP